MKYVIVSQSYLDEEHLAHHGIKGQKWGERHGPPYPLDYDEHTGLEKRLNPKAELSKYDDLVDKNGRRTNKEIIKDHKRLQDAYQKSYRARGRDAGDSLDAERDTLAKKLSSGEINKEQYLKEYKQLDKKYEKVAKAIEAQAEAERHKAVDILTEKYGKDAEQKLNAALKQRERGRAVAAAFGVVGVATAIAVAGGAISLAADSYNNPYGRYRV